MSELEQLDALMATGKNNFVLTYLKKNYEKDLQPKFIKHVFNISRRTAEIKLKILGEKNGFCIKSSLTEPNKYHVCKKEKGDAEGLSFEQYAEKYKSLFERRYELNLHWQK